MIFPRFNFISNLIIIFRELNCSVPTIRRFSEFKFIDNALSKEDLTDQRRENMVQVNKYKSENQKDDIDIVCCYRLLILDSLQNLHRSSIVTVDSNNRNDASQTKDAICKVPNPVQHKQNCGISNVYDSIISFNFA